MRSKETKRNRLVPIDQDHARSMDCKFDGDIVSVAGIEVLLCLDAERRIALIGDNTMENELLDNVLEMIDEADCCLSIVHIDDDI